MRTFLHILACTTLLIVGCTSHLGFKTTYIQQDGITESTQGISAEAVLDLSP